MQALKTSSDARAHAGLTRRIQAGRGAPNHAVGERRLTGDAGRALLPSHLQGLIAVIDREDHRAVDAEAGVHRPHATPLRERSLDKGQQHVGGGAVRLHDDRVQSRDLPQPRGPLGRPGPA
jgi:hypothetical protein